MLPDKSRVAVVDIVVCTMLAVIVSVQTGNLYLGLAVGFALLVLPELYYLVTRKRK